MFVNVRVRLRLHRSPIGIVRAIIGAMHLKCLLVAKMAAILEFGLLGNVCMCPVIL